MLGLECRLGAEEFLMETSNVSQPHIVANVLARHWHITEPATRTDLGVSRATWRVGQSYWLSQAEQVRAPELRRQAALVSDLNDHLRSRNDSIFVPKIVASQRGELVVVEGNYAWCLTHNLQGAHPDATDPGVYAALTEGLARFHAALSTFPASQSVAVPDGIGLRTRQNIDRFAEGAFAACSSDPREEDILREAGTWLLPRLEHFERLPRQIIHGDWTPRNVLFGRFDRPMRLTGVLDFEAMAWDAVCVDVANTCSTLLMWSGLDRLEERIESVVKVYERSSGIGLEKIDIHTAMLAHWLCHYWNWRERLQSGEFGQDVKERLCLRISRVFSFIANLNA